MSTSPSDRLLQVVVDLLVSEGFEGVSVRKVASAADVSVGAVQHHFRTKDAMLQAAMDLASRQFQDRLSRQISPSASPEMALRVVAEELLGLEFAVHGGFVEVSNDEVSLLTDVSEAADAIDVERGLILVKGAVPGPKGGVEVVRSAVTGA